MGKVVGLESDRVWVEIIRQSACNTCAAQKGCGHSVLEKIYSGRRHQVLASTDLHLIEGDEVVLGVPENTVFKGSFILYLVPILSIISGMWAAGLMSSSVAINGDLLSAFGALLGISVGGWFIRRHSRINSDNADYLPTVMRRTSDKNDQPIQLL